MKAITVTLIAQDGQDAESINEDIEQSGLLNNWPVFRWSTEEATVQQKAWFATEYSKGE